jgi:hypothetical protein
MRLITDRRDRAIFLITDRHGLRASELQCQHLTATPVIVVGDDKVGVSAIEFKLDAVFSIL